MTATQTFTSPAFFELLDAAWTRKEVTAARNELQRVGSITAEIDEDSKRVTLLPNGTIVVKGSRMIELGESAAQRDHAARRAYTAGGLGFF